MDTEAPTNPVDGDDTASATVADDLGVDTEGQAADDTQFDDDGNPIVEPPEDSEEIEHEGQKYKLPKALKPLLLMQADYTRKTQELADERKAVQAERTASQQASQAELHAQAKIISLDEQIAGFQNVDWDAWEEQDPFAAAKGVRQLQQLRDARAQAAGQYMMTRQQRESATQQDFAKRVEATQAALAKDIPGWSAETEAKVTDFGMKGYGFTRDELADMKTDPRIAKAFHRLMTLEGQTKSQQRAQSNARAQEVTPAATVGRTSAPPSPLSDKASTDAWIAARNKQAQRRA